MLDRGKLFNKELQELEMRIWSSSLSIEQQNSLSIEQENRENTLDYTEEIQHELWQLIKRKI